MTDWYEVRDLAVLVQLLDRQPDVSGDSERGWSRAEPQGRGGERSAWLAIDDEGQLEVSVDNELAAEATRWWLERIAGELVVFVIGEVLATELGSLPDAAIAPGRRKNRSTILSSIVRS